MAVVPVAQALYLCEEIDVEGGALNLYALFNAIRASGFPHTQESFCVFAQLSGGLGEIPAHFDVVRARDDRVVYVSETQRLRFDRRSQLIRLSVTFEGVTFDEPGVYLVQLFCDNTWVADVPFELREGG
jgi:hypothetical protein